MENAPNHRYGVVLATAASKAEAEAIASALIEAKLAACVSFTPIQSMYTWQGTVHQEEEWQLVIKSELALFDAIAAKVKAVHSYEVPEIIALPILAGADTYLQWISEQVKPSDR